MDLLRSILLFYLVLLKVHNHIDCLESGHTGPEKNPSYSILDATTI